ncbi:MAG TPA: hypothetical protein DHW34_04745 [Actinobacteria bacterium]|nr:hypothetical protein [Actinomycetota bacterium]HCK79305.1 hypothetical protein [Actinomycetota bacterium]
MTRRWTTGHGVVTVLAVLLVTGCSAPLQSARSAATVGPATLSTAEVLDAAQEVQDRVAQAGAPQPAGLAINQALISTWIEEQLTAALAQQARVSVSNAEVENKLREVAQRNGLSVEKFAEAYAVQEGTWVLPSALRDYTKTFLLQQKVSRTLGAKGQPAGQAFAKALTRESQKLGVTVSPRYGAWDAQTLQLVAAPDLVSVPAQPALPGQGAGPADR